MLGVRGLANASSSGVVTLSTASGPGQVTINWTHPGLARLPLNLYRNGVLIATKAVTDTSHVDTIAQGTYTYTAAYVKNGVVGTFSSGVAGVSAATGPAAPTLTSVTSNASGFQITANWGNAGSFITRIYSRTGTPGNYSYTLLASAGAGSTSTSATTTSATAYNIIARHFNGSAESVDSNVITLTTNLGSPTSITFTSVTATSYTVGWTNTDTTAPVDVLRGGVSQGIQAANTTVFAASSLTANTQFSWIVRYSKNAVTGANLTGTQWTRPSAPTGLSVSNTTTPQLTWTNAHSLPVYIYRNGVYLNQVASGTTFTDTTAAAATAYNYTVRHYNATSLLESADSNTASITTILTPPIGFTATATSSTLVQTSWTNAASGVTTFVERSTDGVNYSVANGAGTTGTTFNDSGRTEATTFWYRARHQLSGTFSAYTAAVQVTTPLGSTVQLFSFTGRTTTTITMSWNPPSNANYFVQIYRGDSKLTVNASDNNRGEFSNVTSLYAEPNGTLLPATTYTYGARYRVGSVFGTFSTFTNATRPSNLTVFTVSPVNSTTLNFTVVRSTGEVVDVVVEQSLDGFSWGPGFTINHADFGGGTTWTQDRTGFSAGTLYYFRARARYTALNGITTTSAADSSTTATTPSASATISLSPLAANYNFDQVTATWSTSNAPGGSYSRIEWSWTRYDVSNSQVDSGSGFDDFVISPYIIMPGMDMLESATLNGDTVDMLVTVRLMNASAQQLGSSFRSISFFAPQWGGFL